jgi:hypothetical protein
MARLQILELPEGADDSRPPYVLVVDECAPQRVIIGMDHSPVRDYWREAAEQIGARGVIVTAETVEIPANDVGPEIRDAVQATISGLHELTCQQLSESETLGHKLLQRAEQAEAVTAHTKGLMDRRTRTLRERAEQAEAGRVAADNMLRAVCEVFGGQDKDPILKARETAARAERAERSERDLLTHIEESRRRDVDRMDEVTDALGFDRLRDWGEIVEAIKLQRKIAAEGGHEFGGPGFNDPIRCSRCGLERLEWATRRDVPTCVEARSTKGGE